LIIAFWECSPHCVWGRCRK